MGLLDDVLGQVQSRLGGSAHASHPDLLPSLLQMLGGAGGLSGLVQQLEKAGLGHLVQSWVGTGENLPISPAQLQQVLGGGQLAGLAGKLGLSPEVLAQQLSHVLPHVVDGLTPNGQVPTGALKDGAMDMLKKML